MINCSFTQSQTCTSHSQVDMNTALLALQEAELTSTQKQKMKGIALSMNISKSHKKIKEEIINKLKIKCESNATSEANQTDVFDLKNTTWDCTKSGNILNKTQYVDARSACVVNTLLDNIQYSKLDDTITQDNEGWTLTSSISTLVLLLIVALSGLCIFYSVKWGVFKQTAVGVNESTSTSSPGKNGANAVQNSQKNTTRQSNNSNKKKLMQSIANTLKEMQKQQQKNK